MLPYGDIDQCRRSETGHNRHFEVLETVELMKRTEAKIVANRKEIPGSEPDQESNTWLIEVKLDEDIPDWETVRLDFRLSEIETEILETNISEPDRCTVRTRGQSPLKEGDTIHVDIRAQTEN